MSLKLNSQSKTVLQILLSPWRLIMKIVLFLFISALTVQDLPPGLKPDASTANRPSRKLSDFSFPEYKQKGNFLSKLEKNLRTGLFKLRSGETIKLSEPTMTLLDNSVQNSINSDRFVDPEDAELVPHKRLYKIGATQISGGFAPHADEEIAEAAELPREAYRPLYADLARAYLPLLRFRRYRRGLILPIKVVMRRLKKIKLLKKLLSKKKFLFRRKKWNKSKKLLKVSFKLFKLLLRYEAKYLLSKLKKKYSNIYKNGKEKNVEEDKDFKNPFSKLFILKKAFNLIKANKAGKLFAGLMKSGKIGGFGEKGGYGKLIGIAKFYKTAFKAVKRLYDDKQEANKETNKETVSKDGKPVPKKPKVDLKKKIIGGTLRKILTNRKVADTIADVLSSDAVKKILAIKVKKDPEPENGEEPKKSSPGILEKVMKTASKFMTKDDVGEIFSKIGDSKVWTRKTLAKLAKLDKEKAEREKAEQEKELASKGVNATEGNASNSTSVSTPTPTPPPTVETTPVEKTQTHESEPQTPKAPSSRKFGFFKALTDPDRVTNAFQRVANFSFWKKLPGILERQKKRFGIDTPAPAPKPSEEVKPAPISPEAASAVHTEVAAPIPGIAPVPETPAVTAAPVESPSETPKPAEVPVENSQKSAETPVAARRLLSRSSRRH